VIDAARYNQIANHMLALNFGRQRDRRIPMLLSRAVGSIATGARRQYLAPHENRTIMNLKVLRTDKN
jgi:hypothetical protein